MTELNPSFGETSIFGALSGKARRAIDTAAVEVEFNAGATVFLQGDKGDALYTVVDGLIEISVLAANGRKLSLNLMKPGEVFGEIALLDGGPRTSSATAIQDSCLSKVSKADIQRLLRDRPDIALELIEVLCGRLRWVSQQVEDQVFLPLTVRLAKRLLLLHERMEGTSESLEISQAEVASFVGATRESTNKILNTWRSKGWIEMRRGELRILDWPALTGVAEALD